MGKESFYHELLKQEEELLKALKNIQNLKEYYKPSGTGKIKEEKKKTEKPTEIKNKPKDIEIDFDKEDAPVIEGYKSNDTYKKKVERILNHLGTALSYDVGAILAKLENMNKDYAYKKARSNLSLLYSEGIIDRDYPEGSKKAVYMAKK
ncbi:hypothetical protein H7U19_06915 [Hyunsoonleella sp. SJ7]|uniref:Uncharacterized protein n=1 Tax=Hyunsoonleella aquatilis TaxID=2762758 RepID=A0A923HAI6_9FLAO|nr:hypothetical protein [Hyunsoonleella aquatilis]MBC3758127.1 hypothetical protein [Hyunsoonleella aquatilis]